MRKIKNWSKFNEKPFRVIDDEIKKGDNFIFNDDGQIRKCTHSDTFINYSFSRKNCKKVIFDDTAKMNFEEEKIPTVKTTSPNLKKGDLIYFLEGYELVRGTVESIGPKNVKINGEQYFGSGTYTTSKPFDKVAEPNESIAVVWETWKGVNGRGGYRIERELYSNRRTPAKNWPYQALVWEEHYDEESDFVDHRL